MAVAGRLGWWALSLATFVAIWWAVALLRQDFRLLPTPDLVLAALIAAAKTGALLTNLLITMARVAASFFIAMALGSALGILLGPTQLLGRPHLALLPLAELLVRERLTAEPLRDVHAREHT